MWWNVAVLACCAPVLSCSLSKASADVIEHAIRSAPHRRGVEEVLAEWDQTGEMASASLCELQNVREADGEIAVEQCHEQAVGKTEIGKLPKECQDVVKNVGATKKKVSLSIVKFTKPKTPAKFVEQWPEQTRLFHNLPRPHSPEQARELNRTYFHFVSAGRLLEELGKETFLAKFGRGSTERMRETTIEEMKQRKMIVMEQEVTEAVRVEEKGGLGTMEFANAKSPKGFVKRWPIQKRLFESLPRPLTSEQKDVLRNTFYRFRAAGQLLEELGEEVFLNKFGEGSVNQMRKATVAEMKQRKTDEKDQEMIMNVGEENASDMTAFVRPKSPEDFVKRWPEQKRLYERLPPPLTPTQISLLQRKYYPFAAAGQLLEELGKKVFLQRFGGGFVTNMQKSAAAEIRQRKKAKKDAVKERIPSIGEFVRPKTPKEFADNWLKQKRLFEGLTHPFTIEHKRVLGNTYFPFVAAGKWLERLGREEFLRRFEKGTMADMRMITKAETEQRNVAIEGEQSRTRHNGKQDKSQKKSAERGGRQKAGIGKKPRSKPDGPSDSSHSKRTATKSPKCNDRVEAKVACPAPKKEIAKDEPSGSLSS